MVSTHCLVELFLGPWSIFQYVQKDSARSLDGIPNYRFKQVNHFIYAVRVGRGHGDGHGIQRCSPF